ncbi:protein FAM43A [Hemicordylus capensis]|uniref:protein FAM43A n=1 Tax=Hemicordylus capensis TaxID=884348 RepID=UPI0023020885|nr:protein FAM43A [Hemicordylus capensis]
MRGRPGLRRAPPAEEEPQQQQQQRPGLAAPSSGGDAMLPWKRHKFELLAADEEKHRPRRRQQQQQPPGPLAAASPSAGSSWASSASSSWPGKAKGGCCQAGAGSLPCSAALGSLARACPAEGALSRMGNLFRSKRQKFRVSSEAPTYTVLYLGNATTLQAKGDGCTDVAVGKIWAKSEAGRHGTKMKLTIGPQGIRMAPAAEAAGRPGHLYLLHRVTYCVADPRLPRLFAWIYRHEVKHKAVLLRCHAVLVSKAEKARAMALLLYQTSAAALAEFRRLKKRADARHQQLQQVGQAGGADGAIPLVPLRKLLLHGGPGCCYKPPVERSRSAPKLGSITEDSLGEELEERAAGRGGGCCANGGGGPGDDEEDEDEDEELLAPLGDELEGEGAGRAAAAAPSLGQLISDLGELAIGNDVELLRADLRVTRLLSGESTGSESSIESNGQDGGSPPPALQPCQGPDSPEPDSG